ncbi:hypothetical protein G6L37_02995 [Agrobacterium rubi]|nr:hypothetical protein [Agrobacterium rubi]NTF24345.1 hypothetical protein [Agrobacterium rubi]
METRRRASAETVREIVTETINILTDMGHVKQLEGLVGSMLIDVVTERIRPQEARRTRKPKVRRSKKLKTRQTSQASVQDSTQAATPAKHVPERQEPRIIMPVEESVTDELVYCLFDGIGRKMISRHILARYNMTWPEYLAYCGLPNDYPRVAPKYSEQVSGKMATVLNKNPTPREEARIKRQKAIETKRNRLLDEPDFGLTAKPKGVAV